jgi:CBS domain-containing protein
MLRTSFSAGKILGVELRVHLSFPVLLLLAAVYSTVADDNAVRGVGLWCALLLAVFVREIARAVAGAWAGLRLRAMILLPVGGVMAFAPRGSSEAEPGMRAVTVAGPMANVIAGLLMLGACYGLVPGIHLFEQPWIGTSHVLRSFVWMEFVIGMLGLLPSSLPSRPLLKVAKKNDDKQATPALPGAASGVNIGTILALGAALLGLAIMNPWLVCLGAFFFLASQFGSPAQQALASPAGEKILVRDVMLTEYMLLSASDTLAGALEQSVHSLQDVFPVVRGDQLVGSVARATLSQRFQSGGDAYLQGLMTRTMPVAHPDEKLVDALRRSSMQGAGEFLPVVDEGAMLGILTPQSLSRAVQLVRTEKPPQRPGRDD